MTLQPAHGRDYKSRKAIETDLREHKDFVIADISHPSCGKYINLPQLLEEGYKTVNVRHHQNRKVTVVKLMGLCERKEKL